MTTPPKYEDVVAQLEEARGREAALREELASAYRCIGSCTEQIEEQQQRLIVAEQLLMATSSALDMIADNTDDYDSVEICRERVRLIGAALKPAADAKPSRSCPNCKVCMGSPEFPENCLINGVKP